MKLRSAIEWQEISGPLLDQMRTAPQSTRKDLARMLGNIEGLVQDLAGEEVYMRRNRKSTTETHQRLLTEINQAMISFEQYVMIAHLMGG